jgi:hypothetical protein
MAGSDRVWLCHLFQAALDPKVKNHTQMVNSIYNGWRMEDMWLDQ